MISIIPINFASKIVENDNIVEKIYPTLEKYFPLYKNDVIVIDSLAISYAQGNISTFQNLDEKIKIINDESKRILRKRSDLIISETKHGIICENGGTQEIEANRLALLPKDIDKAAHSVRQAFKNQSNFDVPVIISGLSFNPFRKSKSRIALGISGLAANADELANASQLGITDPLNDFILIRGIDYKYFGSLKSKDLITPNDDKLFS